MHQKQALGMASMGPWTGFSSLKPLNFTEIIGLKSAYCKTHKPRYPGDLKRLQQAPNVAKSSKSQRRAPLYLALGSITKSSRAPRALCIRGGEQGHCPGQGVTTFPAGRPGGGSGRDKPLLSHLLGAALGKDGGHPVLRERAGPVLASQGLPEMRSGQGPPWIPDPVSAVNSGRAGRPVEGPLSRVTPTKPRLRPELHAGGGAPRQGSRERDAGAPSPGPGPPGDPRPAPRYAPPGPALTVPSRGPGPLRRAGSGHSSRGSRSRSRSDGGPGAAGSPQLVRARRSAAVTCAEAARAAGGGAGGGGAGRAGGASRPRAGTQRRGRLPCAPGAPRPPWDGGGGQTRVHKRMNEGPLTPCP